MDIWDSTALVIVAIGSFINALNIRRISRRLDRAITRQADALDREVELTGVVNGVLEREKAAVLREMKR